MISTHAPRTGSDNIFFSLVCIAEEISTHAPRTGSDMYPNLCIEYGFGFQPTLPARGATRDLPFFIRSSQDFNPRSPHGERRADRDAPVLMEGISTHAPRTGSDLIKK